MQKTPILLFYKFLQKRVFFAGTYKMVFGSIRKPIWPYGRFLGQLKTSTTRIKIFKILFACDKCSLASIQKITWPPGGAILVLFLYFDGQSLTTKMASPGGEIYCFFIETSLHFLLNFRISLIS